MLPSNQSEGCLSAKVKIFSRAKWEEVSATALTESVSLSGSDLPITPAVIKTLSTPSLEAVINLAGHIPLHEFSDESWEAVRDLF